MKRALTALGAAGLAFAVISAAPASIRLGRGDAGPARSAPVHVLVDRSFCVSSGIIEHRRGEAIVRFYFTLRNTRRSVGKVDVTPILVFNDGTISKSGKRTITGIVAPAHSVRLYRSPAYRYDARSHLIFGCGLLINGHAVPISYI